MCFRLCIHFASLVDFVVRAVGSPLDVSALQILFYITGRATGDQHGARPAGLILGFHVCVAETAALTHRRRRACHHA